MVKDQVWWGIGSLVRDCQERQAPVKHMQKNAILQQGHGRIKAPKKPGACTEGTFRKILGSSLHVFVYA